MRSVKSLKELLNASRKGTLVFLTKPAIEQRYAKAAKVMSCLPASMFVEEARANGYHYVSRVLQNQVILVPRLFAGCKTGVKSNRMAL